ncbi:MAG TPA: hypothetical protein VK463_10085, partial [Desulfomonilaceae bacterium]|nr:hypothetical protein [Desulfomonilaceae bacterium]
MIAKRYMVLLVLVLAMSPYFIRLAYSPTLQLHDDAYYYFKIARNIAAGHGSTFDTLSFTNGYHPLWMAICVSLATFVTKSNVYVYCILVINLLFIVLLSHRLFAMTVESLGVYFAGFLVCLVNWSLYTNLNLLSGLETALYLYIVLIVVDLLPRVTWTSKRDLLTLGVLLALAFLARTDFVLFFPVLAVYFFLFGPRKSIGLYRLLACWLMLPMALIVTPYLAWNYFETGHFEQLSGLVQSLHKTNLPVSSAILNALKDLTKGILLRPLYLNAFMAVWLCLCGWAVLKGKSLVSQFKDVRLFLLTGFSVVLFSYYFMNYADLMRAWHIMIPWVTSQILLVHLLKGLWEAVAQRLALRIVVLVLTLLMCINYFTQIPLWTLHARTVDPYFLTSTNYYKELADWMRNNLPPGAKIAVCNAGYIGFFSDRTIINLDGLVNGTEFYHYLKDGRGRWQFAFDKKLDYFADHFFGPPDAAFPPEVRRRMKLVHTVGRKDVLLAGRPTYVDAYV